jgi:hypothetical protein
MQTFLPHGDYEASAQSLDNKRLNKQILEGYQILKVLSGASPSGAWRNHPAVLMWKNAEYELVNYIDHMVYEAEWRGIKTINNKRNLRELASQYKHTWSKQLPFWMEDDITLRCMTTTHKVSLFNKDPMAYASFQPWTNSPYNVTCCDTCKYYWPTHPLRNMVK